jgi:transcriptional regulator with XRE-family HTH domain
MSLGQNIKRLRQARGWTQGQLSERTGIKIGHLSKLEQDEGDPKASTLYKLLEAFGCTPTNLMADPKTQYGHEAALLAMIWERVEELPDKAKGDLIEVLDRFCMGWEMELTVTQSPRRWQTWGKTTEPEESPKGT